MHTTCKILPCKGVVAQLVEHLHGMQGVVGSSPISSTKINQVREKNPQYGGYSSVG